MTQLCTWHLPEFFPDCFHAAFRLCTGVALILDVTLLLAHSPKEIRPLLEQLHGLKQHMPRGAQVMAYIQEEHAGLAAKHHLGDSGASYWGALTDYNAELCQVLSYNYVSKRKEPAATQSLRNAHKVSRIQGSCRQCCVAHTLHSWLAGCPCSKRGWPTSCSAA